MTTTIYEKVLTALTPLGVPFAWMKYIPATGNDLPDLFLVALPVSDTALQTADDIETLRLNRIQISIYNRAGLVGLPDVDTAMVNAGFMKSRGGPLAFDDISKHFGIYKEFTLL